MHQHTDLHAFAPTLYQSPAAPAAPMETQDSKVRRCVTVTYFYRLISSDFIHNLPSCFSLFSCFIFSAGFFLNHYLATKNNLLPSPLAAAQLTPSKRNHHVLFGSCRCISESNPEVCQVNSESKLRFQYSNRDVEE